MSCTSKTAAFGAGDTLMETSLAGMFPGSPADDLFSAVHCLGNLSTMLVLELTPMDELFHLQEYLQRNVKIVFLF